MFIFIKCSDSAVYLHMTNRKHHFVLKVKGIRRYQKGKTEIVKSEDRQGHGQQNKTKDKQRTHNTSLKTLQKPG